MFDTNKVANNIKNARTKLNMTQMNLADEMGVSYQAVSNWERGNSMPDISKLPELCKILNISFQELVGERIPETATVERLLQDEAADVSLEEMAQIGQLVKPNVMENKVQETIEKGRKISFSVLVSLAPFMDKEYLGKLAETTADIDLRKLCRLAPFLKKETLDVIIDKAIQADNMEINKIVALAPFLSKSTIQKIAAYFLAHNQAKKLVALAPFMGKEMLSSQLKDVQFDMLEKGDADSSSAISDLDADDVAKLAIEALEQGGDAAQYLDYLDEDDVAKIANKALELGKEISIYLDYLDEDALKSLLLKAVRDKHFDKIAPI